MRFVYVLAPFFVVGPALASLFGSDDDDSSSTSTSTAAASSTTSSSEVDFLETLQAAEIASMSCLITLVNLTTTNIGTCLGLTSLADLISNPAADTAFSDQLSTYLGTVCSETCADSDLEEGMAQLEANCDTSNSLVGALDEIMDNYSSSYRTLACEVYYNDTSNLCLPATLNTSTTANTNTFFSALVRGSTTDLEEYQDSVFTQAECTGCMYELFKAAQYTISSIRDQNLTEAFGDHLQNDCPSSSDSTGNSTETITWSDVEDQQIPDCLEVSQSTQTTSAAVRSARGWKDRNGGLGGGFALGLGLGSVGVVLGTVLGLEW